MKTIAKTIDPKTGNSGIVLRVCEKHGGVEYVTHRFGMVEGRECYEQGHYFSAYFSDTNPKDMLAAAYIDFIERSGDVLGFSIIDSAIAHYIVEEEV